MRRPGLAVAIAAAITAAAAIARADVAFQTRDDVDIGSAPAGFAILDSGGVVVAGDRGVSILRAAGGGLVYAGRLKATDYAKMVAAGTLGSQRYVAYGDRSAKSVSLARERQAGRFAPSVSIALPAPPRLARFARIGKDKTAALLVAHDDGITIVAVDAAGRFVTSAVEAPRLATDLAVADLDGDGIADLAVVNESDLHILTGRADGSFGSDQRLASVRGPRRVVAADLDGDGRPELLVIGGPGLVVHRRDGEGHLGAPSPVRSSPRLSGVATGDVDGDGRLDVAVIDGGHSTITFLLGKPDGFEEGGSYLVGREPDGVILADENGDGRLDALVLNRIDASITVLRNRGGGDFDGIRCVLGGSEDLGAIAVADFDRDSHVDIAVTSEESGLLSVFLSSGTGRFTARQPVPIGRQPRALVAADLDGDGKPDLATANFGSDEVAVMQGDGRGGFAAPTLISVGLGPSAIVAGAFSGSRLPDLAVANLLSDSVSVLYGDGHGGFATVTNFPVVSQPSFLLVGDVDQDGHADLVVGSRFSESVSILHGDGRELAEPETTTLAGAARPSVAEDFDGDGLIDLVAIDESGDQVEILPGIGPGQFGPPISFRVGRDARAVAAADFNGDGRIDLAVVHAATRTIAIVLNRSERARPRGHRRRTAT